MVSILAGDFYKMSISVAFVFASVYVVAVMRCLPFAERINRFSRGVSDSNILLMIWIFVLAGAEWVEEPLSELENQNRRLKIAIPLSLLGVHAGG